MKTVKLNLFNLEKSPTGRIYSISGIESAINDFVERTNKGDLMLGKMGDINHTCQYVQLQDVSHKVTDLYVDNNDLIADIDMLDTPNGKILQKINIEDYTPQVILDPNDFEETIDENGNKIVIKCKINRVDFVPKT